MNIYEYDRSEFVAVPIRILLRFMLMMRCRAIVCSQYEQDCEQAHVCSIAPSGTARRKAQIRVCRDEVPIEDESYEPIDGDY